MDAKDYKYNLPEDYELKPKHRAKIDALVEKAGMSNELAQEFIDLHVEITEEFAAELEAAHSQH